MYFVEQPSLEALLRDARGSHCNVLVPCRVLCLTNGAFNAVGDKCKWRTFFAPLLRGGMGDNKTRCKGRIAAPGLGEVEHSPSCHHCSSRFQRVPNQLGTLW